MVKEKFQILGKPFQDPCVSTMGNSITLLEEIF